MKIVIDIPEAFEGHFNQDRFRDSFERVIQYTYRGFLSGNYERETLEMLIKAFENGTPLPEHHGRLIDADELKRTMEKDMRRALSFVDLTDFVWLAPTIIEGSESE